MLTIKNKRAVYFPSEMSLYGIAEEFETSKLWWTMNKWGEQRRKACFYSRKEEARMRCFTEFSLTVLLLGEEKFFLLLGWEVWGVCKVSCFLLGIWGMLLRMSGSAWDFSLEGFLTSFKMCFLMFIFTYFFVHLESVYKFLPKKNTH